MNAPYDDEGNNDVFEPGPPTNDVNINDNSDDEKMTMGSPLIHLKIVEIIKQLTMMRIKI